MASHHRGRQTMNSSQYQVTNPSSMAHTYANSRENEVTDTIHGYFPTHVPPDTRVKRKCHTQMIPNSVTNAMQFSIRASSLPIVDSREPT